MPGRFEIVYTDAPGACAIAFLEDDREFFRKRPTDDDIFNFGMHRIAAHERSVFQQQMPGNPEVQMFYKKGALGT